MIVGFTPGVPLAVMDQGVLADDIPDRAPQHLAAADDDQIGPLGVKLRAWSPTIMSAAVAGTPPDLSAEVQHYYHLTNLTPWPKGISSLPPTVATRVP